MPLPTDVFNSEQREGFREALVQLDELYRAMAKVHKENETNLFANGAHALDHDLAVGAFAHAIARHYSDSLVRTSLAVSLMHSYDRHPRSRQGPETFTEADVREWTLRYLGHFTEEEKNAVVQAVLAHDKPNKGKITASPTTGDILADADKLANMMVYSMIRLGQFAAQMPPVRLGNLDGKTPGATYKNYNVVLDDAYSRLEWFDDLRWFVTEEAKQVAKSLEGPWKSMMADIRAQFMEMGLGQGIL